MLSNSLVEGINSFNILFYQSPQPMWIYDLETFSFLEVNESAVGIYGYSKEEFLGMTIKDIRPSENLKDIILDKKHSRTRTNTSESRHIYKCGKHVDVEVTSFPFIFLSRKCRLAYVRDITVKKKRQTLLEFLNKAGAELSHALETEKALEKISELVVPKFADWFTISVINGKNIDLLFVKNEDPQYTNFAYEQRKQNPVTVDDNSYTASILRTGEAAFVPFVTDKILEASITDKEQVVLLKAMNLQSSIVVPMFVRERITGSINFLSTTVGKHYDEEDLNFAKDFANRIALTLENARLYEEAQLEIEHRIEAEKKKDEFIGVASHELKTPLTTLSASLQMLKQVYGKDPAASSIPRLLENSNTSLKKLSLLVNRLLNTAKIEQGQLSLSKTSINLYKVAKECAEQVEVLGSHTLEIQGLQDIVVQADELRISQVITNFVNNAAKYSKPQTLVQLRVEKVGDKVKLSVKDQGIGIAAEKIPYLFQRYYQIDTSSIQYAGLGLGLYISSEIIKLHEGEIGVESEPEKGSTFWFTLPLAGF